MKPAPVPEFLRRRSRLIWPLAALLLLALFGYGSCTVYVRPGQYGVKQVVVGPSQGIRPEVFHPGLHFMTPGVERMHGFWADMQGRERSDGSGHEQSGRAHG